MRSGLDYKIMIDFWRTSWDGPRWVQERRISKCGLQYWWFGNVWFLLQQCYL